MTTPPTATDPDTRTSRVEGTVQIIIRLIAFFERDENYAVSVVYTGVPPEHENWVRLLRTEMGEPSEDAAGRRPSGDRGCRPRPVRAATLAP